MAEGGSAEGSPTHVVMSAEGELRYVAPAGRVPAPVASWLRALVHQAERAASGAARRAEREGVVATLERLHGQAEHGYLITLRREPAEPAPLAGLSPRQAEVAELAAHAATVPEIARSLGLSPNTVKRHLHLAYAQLGVASRAELVALVHGRGRPLRPPPPRASSDHGASSSSNPN